MNKIETELHQAICGQHQATEKCYKIVAQTAIGFFKWADNLGWYCCKKDEVWKSYTSSLELNDEQVFDIYIKSLNK